MKEVTAALHLKLTSTRDVRALAERVYACISANLSLFPESESVLPGFQVALDKLNALICAKDGSKIIYQAIADQTEVVHRILKMLSAIVNRAAQGDRATILLSGFDCSKEPKPRPKPEKCVIRRVDDGKKSGSIKIYLLPLAYADFYKVEIAFDSTGEWNVADDYGSFKRLEIEGLERGREIFVRVSGGNTRGGWGEPSDPAAFIPR
ncbi:MAG: hypothetical protein H6Q17_2437 [Bacteroidetes bacterium]|nr:hypothetical protein [Bacteroidota bacterium]